MGTKGYIAYKKVLYKYKLTEDYIHKLSFTVPNDIITEYIELYKDGTIIIKKSYCWDGCSGLAIDDDSNMRGGLVHDSLYQLMREGHLSLDLRELADKELEDTCKEDGMNFIRGELYFEAVEIFGEQYAKKQEEKIYYSPANPKFNIALQGI